MIEGGPAIPGDICLLETFPEEYRGDLFLIDYHGWINTITIEDDKVTAIKAFAKLEKGITDLKFNPMDGKLYYVHLIEGKVRQITFGGIRPPNAEIEVDQFFGASPLAINFVGENSQSFDESQLSYEWDFGDNTTSNEENPTHTYDIGSEIKTYEVQLVVRDTSGNVGRSKQLISVNNTPPAVSISSIVDNQTYSQSTINIFDLEATVIDNESADENLEYSWQVNLHHSEHVHLGPIDNDHITYALIDPTGCDLESFFYKVTLKVEDEHGLLATDEVNLMPYCGDDFSEFVSLVGQYEDEGIRLIWDIGIEQDVKEYIIEKTDNFRFEPIGVVSANGSSSYDFLDTNPFIGDNFYRIRSVNTNGDRDYSNVVSRIFTQSFGYSIAPNPVFDLCHIEVTQPSLATVDFRLFDASGKLYTEENLEFTNSQFAEFSVNMVDVPSGVYFYSLIVNGESVNGRLVKF